MKSNLKVGDVLVCKYRGAGKVTKIQDDQFWISFKGVNYIQNFEDIGKIIFENKEGAQKSFKVVYTPLRYNQCVINIGLLEKDKVLKEEAIYLCKVRNILENQIFILNQRLSKYDREDWTYSPTPDEIAAWQDAKLERIRKEKEKARLEKRNSEPYFARMDFERQNDGKLDKVYIGQVGINHKGENLVYDWRSPLGQRYYRRNELEFELNGYKYVTQLIRKFDIKKAKLYKYYTEYSRNIDSIEDTVDVNKNSEQDSQVVVGKNTSKNIEIENKPIETNNGNSDSKINIENNIKESDKSKINNISDPFLLSVLESKRNVTEIGNIISTIQNNQNDIITSDLNENIIVQGCAGSGKTMILLHRLSYLLYNNKNLDLNTIKIITPNKLFNMNINALADNLGLKEIETLIIEEYLEEKSKQYNANFKYNFSDDNMPNEMTEYIYSDGFIDKLNYAYNQYIDSCWKVFKDNDFEDLAGVYNVSVYEGEKKNKYKYLKSLFLAVEKEFKTKDKEYHKLLDKISNLPDLYKKEIEKYKDTDNYTKPYKELIELLKEKEKIKWFDLNKKREINSVINKLRINLHLSEDECSIAYIEKTIDEIISNRKILIDNFSIANNYRLNEYEKYAAVFKEKYFLDKEPDEIYANINKMYDLFPEEKISFENKSDKQKMQLMKEKQFVSKKFLEESIYKPLIKRISEKFNYHKEIKGRAKAYILLNLLYMHEGPLSKEDKMICFDEGQDIKKSEYKLIDNINGNKIVFNILGDTNQLINSSEGICDWKEINDIREFKMYELNENYRNSQEITRYCVNETGYEMNPIGIDDGKVVVADYNSLGLLNTTIKFISDTGRRKAIIVKEINPDIMDFLTGYFGTRVINIISSSKESIDIDRINVITVRLSKGMEFDSTLVVTKDMNNNEKYIALTRALINTYVINLQDAQ